HQNGPCTSTFVCRCGEPHSTVVCQMPPNPRGASPLNHATGSARDPNQTQVKQLASTNASNQAASPNSQIASNTPAHIATISTAKSTQPLTVETPMLKYAAPQLQSYLHTVLVSINGHPVRVLLD